MSYEKIEYPLYVSELQKLGLDEGLIDHACNDNENNLLLQLEELHTTVNLLESTGMTKDEQKYFVSMASDVLYQYWGDQRTKEKYKQEIMPTFIHLLKAIQVATNTYAILSKPEEFHELGLPFKFFDEHEKDIDTYRETWKQNTLVIALGLLYHDSPEDFKFMLFGDIEDVDGYKDIETDIFVGKKKNLEIRNIETCAMEHIYPCDIDILLGSDGSEEPEYANIGPLCVLRDWRKLYEENKEEAFKVLNNDAPTEQKRELFLGMSYYHILRRTLEKGNEVKICLQSMEVVDKVTFRSMASVNFTSKADLLRGIYQSPRAAIMKGGDVGHNFSTLELLKQAKPDNREIIAYKYNDYLDTFEAAASFWLEVYPIVCDRMGMDLDPQMKEKIDAYKARKKQLDNQTRSSQPLYTHHKIDYTSHSKLMSEIVEKAKLLLLDETGIDKDKIMQRLFDEIFSLSDSLEDFASPTGEGSKDFTLMDTFNAGVVYDAKENANKNIPMQDICGILTSYLSDDEYTIGSELPYGFEVKPEGMNKLNMIVNKALQQYHFELYGHIPSSFLKEPNIYKVSGPQSYEIRLKTTKDLLRFFQVASKIGFGQRKQFACSLLKLGFQRMLLQDDDILSEQDESFARILGENFLSTLVLTDSMQDKISELNKVKGLYKLDGASWHQYFAGIENICTNGGMNITWNHDVIKGSSDNEVKLLQSLPDVAIENIYVATKTGETASHKQFDIPDYTNFELAHELHAIRCEVKDIKDVLLTAQYMYYTFFDKGISGMKNIRLLSHADLKKYRDILTQEFYEKLFFSLITDEVDDPNSHEEFKEFRISGYVGLNPKIPANLRIIMSDATNEYDLSHFAVHEGGNKIKTMIRLEGYVNKDYVKHVARMQVYKHPEVKRIGTPPTFDTAVAKIVNHRTNNLLLEIRQTHTSQAKSTFYTTKKRWNGLKQQGFFTDTQLSYNDEWIDTMTPDADITRYHERMDTLFRKVTLYGELKGMSENQRGLIQYLKTKIYTVIDSYNKIVGDKNSKIHTFIWKGLLESNNKTIRELKELLAFDSSADIE